MSEILAIKVMKMSPLNLVIVGMWILFFHEILKAFGVIQMYVSYSGYFILLGALLIELKNGYLSFLDGNYRLWILSISIFSIFALFYGVFKEHSLQFIVRDLWPYAYFACLLVAARINTLQTIDRMIYQQFFVGFAVFLFIFATVGPTSISRSLYDSSAVRWGEPNLYSAWGLLYGWMYMFLTYNKKQPTLRKIVAFLGMLCYIAYGIMMLKRQVLFDLGMLSILKLIYVGKVEKVNIARWIFAFITIIAVIIPFVGFFEKSTGIEYFNAYHSRLTEHGSIVLTISENTRLTEHPLNIYNQASDLEVLFGQGLGSSVVKDGILDTVVESGFFTTFLKGGLIYLVVWYIVFFLILKSTFLGWRRPEKILFGMLSSVFMLSSILGPFFIDHFSTGYKMFWIGVCASLVRVSNPAKSEP